MAIDMSAEGIWYTHKVHGVNIQVFGGSSVGVYGTEERLIKPEEDALWWLQVYARKGGAGVLSTLCPDAREAYNNIKASDLIVSRISPQDEVGPAEMLGQPVRIMSVSSEAY